jgi:hypothetical protein
MINAVITKVTIATVSILLISYSAQKFSDGAGVSNGTDGHVVDSRVGGCQKLWNVVDLTNECDSTTEDVGRGCPNAFEGGEHSVEQRDENGNYRD